MKVFEETVSVNLKTRSCQCCINYVDGSSHVAGIAAQLGTIVKDHRVKANLRSQRRNFVHGDDSVDLRTSSIIGEVSSTTDFCFCEY